MRIAIDLNDVVRDFSRNFLKYYIEGYNHEFDLTDFEFWTHDMSALFPFKSDMSYNNFVYNDYAFELFGKCGTCTRNLEGDINIWTEQTLKDIDTDEPVELLFVSPMEYGLSIGNTYFFISKLGTKIREVYLPVDSKTIWERCDVLVTANPYLISIKPEDKTIIKISCEYNKDAVSDYTYMNLSKFMADKKIIQKIINRE